MNTLDWKRKLLGHHPMGGDGGGDGGGGGDSNAFGGSPAEADLAGGYAGGTSSESPGGFSLAELAAPEEPSEAPTGPASGGVAGTPGPGKAGETAVGGTGYMGGSNAATRATAEMMGNTMAPGSAVSQLENSAMASQPGFSTSGISKAALDGLADAGLGNQAVSDNQTVNHARASINVADNIAPVVAGLITSAVPGGNLAVSGVRALGAVTSGQLTPAQAAQGFFGNLIAGQINQAVMGALPEGVSSAIAGANQVSTAGRVLGIDLPSINPGRAIVDAVLGGPSLSSSGPINSGGSAIEYGEYGGGDQAGGQTPAAPATPPSQGGPSVATPANLRTNMRFNLGQAAAMGRAIRAGAMSRGGSYGLRANRG